MVLGADRQEVETTAMTNAVKEFVGHPRPRRAGRVHCRQAGTGAAHQG
jgi:hypothetical protein